MEVDDGGGSEMLHYGSLTAQEIKWQPKYRENREKSYKASIGTQKATAVQSI